MFPHTRICLALHRVHLFQSIVHRFDAFLWSYHQAMTSFAQTCWFSSCDSQSISQLVYCSDVPVCLLLTTLQESSGHGCLPDLETVMCCHLQETVLCPTCCCRRCHFQQLVFQVTSLITQYDQPRFDLFSGTCFLLRPDACPSAHLVIELSRSLRLSFLFFCGLATNCPGRCTDRLCCDALFVPSMLRKTARESCLANLVGSLDLFRPSCSACM